MSNQTLLLKPLDSDSVQFRCPNGKIHGIRREFENGKVVLEVRCKDRFCTKRGDGSNTVVFHYFDIKSGKLVQTKRYRDVQTSSTPQLER